MGESPLSDDMSSIIYPRNEGIYCKGERVIVEEGDIQRGEGRKGGMKGGGEPLRMEIVLRYEGMRCYA